MFTIPWLISFILVVISFVGIVLTSKLLFKPFDEYKFSFMRIFPFEIINNSGSNAKIYSLSTYLFAGMCFSPLLLVISEQVTLKSLNPMSILISCILGLAGLCFIFLNVFDVTHTKPHLVIFGIFASLTLLAGILVSVRGFIAYDIFLKHSHVEYIFIISAGLCELFSVVPVLAIILNPKLKSWPRLDKVDDQYVRPKRFPLAYSEWGILLSLFFVEILYFIQLLVK